MGGSGFRNISNYRTGLTGREQQHGFPRQTVGMGSEQRLKGKPGKQQVQRGATAGPGVGAPDSWQHLAPEPGVVLPKAPMSPGHRRALPLGQSDPWKRDGGTAKTRQQVRASTALNHRHAQAARRREPNTQEASKPQCQVARAPKSRNHPQKRYQTSKTLPNLLLFAATKIPWAKSTGL